MFQKEMDHLPPTHLTPVNIGGEAIQIGPVKTEPTYRLGG